MPKRDLTHSQDYQEEAAPLVAVQAAKPSGSGGAVTVHGHTDASTGGKLYVGTTTGDFIRYDAVSGRWEATAEPLLFRGLVLTPALASLIDAEGAIYYNSASKAVMVCTDI
jgi:hypothetical protein